MVIITALASAVATMAGVMWKMQTTETKFWRELYLGKGDKYEKTVDLLTEWIKSQEGAGRGTRGR